MPASCDELKKLINFGRKNLGDTKKTNFPKTCGWPRSKGLESQDSDEMLGKLGNALSAFSRPQPNRRKCQCGGDVCPLMGERNAGKNLKSFSPCGNVASLFRDPTGLKNRKPRVPCAPNLTMEEVKKRCKEIESKKNGSSGDETKSDPCCSDSDEKVITPVPENKKVFETPKNSVPLVPEKSKSLDTPPKHEQEKKTGGNCPPTDLCRNFFCVIENILCSFLLLISTIFQTFACLLGMPPLPCPCRESAHPNEQHRVSKPSTDRRLGCCCNVDGTYFHNTNAFSFVVDWISTAICCLFSGGSGRTRSKHSNVSVKTSKTTAGDQSVKSIAGSEKTKGQLGEVKPVASAEERASKKTLQLPGLDEHPHVHDIDNFVLTHSYIEKSVFGGQQSKKLSSKSIIDDKKTAPKPSSTYTNTPSHSTKASAVPKKSKSGSKSVEKKTLSSSTATDNLPSLKHASTSPEKSTTKNKSTSSYKLTPSIPAEERTTEPPVGKPPSESSEKSKSESKTGTTESVPSFTDKPAVKKTFHQAKRTSQEKSKGDFGSPIMKESDQIRKKETHREKSSISSHSKTKSVPRVSTIEEETLPADDHDVQRQDQVEDQASTVPEMSEMSKSESKGDVEESVSETVLPQQRQSQFAKSSDSQERSEVKNTTPDDTVPPVIEAEFHRRHSQFEKHSSESQEKSQLFAFPDHGPRLSQQHSHRSKHRSKKSKSKSSSKKSGSNKSLRKTSSKRSSTGGQKHKIGHPSISKQESALPEESDSKTGVGKKTFPNVPVIKEQLMHSYIGKEATADPEKSESKREGVDLRNSSISTIGDVEAVRLSNLAKKTSQVRVSRSGSKSINEARKTDSVHETIRMSNIAAKVSKARTKSKGSKGEDGRKKHSRSKRSHKSSSRISMPKQQSSEAEEPLAQMSSGETVSKMESNQQLSAHPSTTNQEGEVDHGNPIEAQIASQSKLDSEASSTE